MSISLIVCIVGGLVYLLLAGDSHRWNVIAELGRAAFWMGLLAFLLGK